MNTTAAAPRPIPRRGLTINEACISLGMGETSFKKYVLPQVRVVRRGKLRIIPISELDRWLDDNAEKVLDDAA